MDELGLRFPDMSKSYDQHLRNKAKEIALKNGINVREGVYVGVSGPTFETPAEYLMFRHLGADIVGMSTVPEVIVARHMDMTVFGISIVTDSGVPGQIVEISHEEVQEVAMKAEPNMTLILKELLQDFRKFQVSGSKFQVAFRSGFPTHAPCPQVSSFRFPPCRGYRVPTNSNVPSLRLSKG